MSCPSDTIRERLEEHGFSLAVAGEEDVRNILQAVELMQSSGKGLLVSGRPGVGKTQLVRALKWLVPFGRYVFELGALFDPDVFSIEYQEYVGGDLYERNLVLDDIGAESPVNDFGVRKEPVGEFLMAYYARGRGRILATTNLDYGKFAERYGARVASRLKTLFVPLRLLGKDKRQWTLDTIPNP